MHIKQRKEEDEEEEEDEGEDEEEGDEDDDDDDDEVASYTFNRAFRKAMVAWASASWLSSVCVI